MHGLPKPQRLEWFAENSRAVGPERFHKVENLISQTAGDCVDLLGTDSAAWILRKQEGGELEYASKSWGGTLDPLEYWNITGQIFSLVFKGEV